MKNIFSLMLLVAYVSAQAQTMVPVVVGKAFAKKFPDAKNIKWGKENAKEYEANFKLNNVNMSANYDLQGNLKETEKEILVKELPDEVVKAIQKKYVKAVIYEADKIEKQDGKIIYETDIKINGRKKELELYADGRFVRM
jgi:hypothetical protein